MISSEGYTTTLLMRRSRNSWIALGGYLLKKGSQLSAYPKSRRSFPREMHYNHVVACGRVAQLGEHLLCKKAGKITQVPHLVSLTRKRAVQTTS